MSPSILEILLFIQEPSLTCKDVLDLLFYSLLSGHAIKTTTKIWVFCSVQHENRSDSRKKQNSIQKCLDFLHFKIEITTEYKQNFKAKIKK